MKTVIDMIDGETGEVIHTRVMKSGEPSEKQIRSAKEDMIQSYLMRYILMDVKTREERKEYYKNPGKTAKEWRKEGRKKIEWRVYKTRIAKRGMTKSDCLSELEQARMIACQTSELLGGSDFGRGQVTALDLAIELVSSMGSLPKKPSGVVIGLSWEQAKYLRSLMGNGPLEKAIKRKVEKGIREF